MASLCFSVRCLCKKVNVGFITLIHSNLHCLNIALVLLCQYQSSSHLLIMRLLIFKILLQQFVNYPTPTTPKHFQTSMEILLSLMAFLVYFILVIVSFTSVILFLRINIWFLSSIRSVCSNLFCGFHQITYQINFPSLINPLFVY